MIKTYVNKIINSNYYVAICFIIAILLRVCWIILVDSKPASDSTWYYEKGIEIASGKGYSIDGTPTAYYPVGYPMFLGLIFKIFGNSLLLAKLVNILLSIGIIYFSYFLSKKIFDSEKIGRITLFILAIYPNHIAYASILATEILFLFLLLFGAYLLFISGYSVSQNRSPESKAIYRYLTLVICGIVWGFMCLVKPQGFFIPLIFLLTFLLYTKQSLWEKLRPVLIIYVLIIIVLLPWVIRNNRVFNEFFIISTNDGINLVMGNNPYSTGEYNLDDTVISYIWDGENEYSSPDSLIRNIHITKYWTRYGYKDENIANKKLRKKALDFIINNPSKIMKLLPKKLWLNYKKGNEGIGWAIADITIDSALKKKVINIFGKIANYFYYLIMFLSLFYFISSVYKLYIKRQKINFPLTGLFIILYFTMLALIYFGGYRFLFPAIPFIAMYASAFIDNFLGTKNKINLAATVQK